MYSARQPSRVTDQGRPCSAIVSATADSKRSPSAIMRSNASSVSTSPSVARTAARDSALPASVPPTPPTSAVSQIVASVIRSATSSVKPYAPTGTPPPIGLPIVSTSGSRP